MYELKNFTPIARTNWRSQNVLFGIKPADRLLGIYSIGKTGMGKSNLLINIAFDDIIKGHGVCLLDPHGDTVLDLIRRIPKDRLKDVVYFDATNTNSLPGLNPLYNVPEHLHQLVASELVLTFKKMFQENWGNRLEYYMRNILLTLLQVPNATLLDIQPLLTDKTFRTNALQSVKSKYLLSFWKTEYDQFTPSVQTTTIMPILNKIGVFMTNETLRGIVGQGKGLSMEYCMDHNKIVLCNLSKGGIGSDISTILGGFITTSIQACAMRRSQISAEQRKAFYVFLDEAHNYISSSFATMVSELRKFRIGLFITNQHISQLDDEVRQAILANISTFICFRLGLPDAKIMEKEFLPIFNYEDFINLPRYHIYIKLAIDGTTSKGFSAVTSLNNFDVKN